MTAEIITPGYEWSEIPPEDMLTGDFGISTATPLNLQELYPIDNEKLLQQTWDGRTVNTAEAPNGVGVTTVTFNVDAENGSILWLPGWDVSNLRGSGARAVTVLAALNPDKVVVAAEELENVPDAHKQSAAEGNMQPYADNYMFAVDEQRQRPDVLSGHSRGGIIHTHLGARSDMEGLTTINLIDMPRARSYMTAFGFGLRVGLLDNRIQGKYKHLSSAAEEDLLLKIIADGVSNNGSQMEALKKAKEKWWLVRAMGKEGLRDSIKLMLEAQPVAEIYWWHGTKNIGTPVEAMRRLVQEVRTELPSEPGRKIRYFESPTGHFSEGHIARYGRQTAYAIDQTAA